MYAISRVMKDIIHYENNNHSLLFRFFLLVNIAKKDISHEKYNEHMSLY